MRINSEDKLFGFPIMKIRQIFKNAGNKKYTNINYKYHVKEISRYLKISQKRTKELIDEFFKEGYFEYQDLDSLKNHFITTTLKGQSIANSTADKPINRKTANKILEEFLVRVQLINSSNKYAYLIKIVKVFGSFLSEKEKINDIDLAIELMRITDDNEKFKRICNHRINLAHKNNRYFSNYFNELLWPKNEIYLYLKDRKKSIQIHSIDDGVIDDNNSKVIYEYN